MRAKTKSTPIEVSRSRENFVVHEPYSEFKSWLTSKVMDDPVLISSVHTYEKEAILHELSKGCIEGSQIQDGTHWLVVWNMIPICE